MNGRFLGRVLKGFHAGEKHLAWNDAVSGDAPAIITLTSPAFHPGGTIPSRHAGKGVGENVSPALAWLGVPASAKEIVIIVEDRDAPLPRPFVHAVAFALGPTTTSLGEGQLSSPPADGPLGLGKNSFRKTGYVGPRPIPGHGPHTYVFQIFALDRRLSFTRAPSRSEVVKQMRGAVIGAGRLDGVFER